MANRTAKRNRDNRIHSTSQSVSTPPLSKRLRVLFLLAAFAGLLVLASLLHIPSRWMEFFASRALDNYRPVSSLAWIERSTRLAPGRAPAHLLAARAYLQLNFLSQAEESLELAEATSDDPSLVKAYKDLLLSIRGDQAAAQRVMNEHRGLLPAPVAMEGLVRCGLFNNDQAMIDGVFAQWLEFSPADPMRLYLMGRNKELQLAPDEAFNLYEQAAQADRPLPKAAFRAGLLLQEQGEFEAAIAMFSKCAETPISSIAEVEIANCYWELAMHDRAFEVLSPHLSRLPGELLPQYLQAEEFADFDQVAMVAARITYSTRQHAEALAFLQRVLEHNHRNFEARAMLINCLQELGRAEEARQVSQVQAEMILKRQRSREIRSLLEENPTDAVDLRAELAEIYWETESLAEAQMEVDAVLKDDPNHPRAISVRERLRSERERLRGLPSQPPL